MAIQLDISQNAYSKLERGVTKLTMERLNKIARILDTSHEHLIRVLENCH